MAVRYIPKSDFVCADRQGRRRMFKVRRQDGMVGYDASEVKGLYKDHLGMFRRIEVSEVVEQATAAPGEKRARKPKGDSSEDSE